MSERMIGSNHMTRRGFVAGTLGIVGLGAGPATSVLGLPPSTGNTTARIPVDRIGVQLFTVRDLLDEQMLGLEGTLELVREVGFSRIELAGNFMGHSPSALRALAERSGLQITGNHFGPRSMGGENRWYDAAGRAKIFTEAQALGVDFVGTGHYYNVPLEAEAFRRFAETLNEWGAAASAAGLKFYYHNHDGEFTRSDGRPIFEILLEETDPDHVFFELDLGWAAIAGEDVAEMVRRDQSRFPLFHVKDFRFDPAGPREAKPGTLAAGERFSFTDVGKGQVDWAGVFSGLTDPSRHVYFIERDDAGNDEVGEGSPARPTNPAGSANTLWTSYKHLTSLQF